MWKFLLIGCVTSAIALGQTAASSIDVANLREDVRGLTQRVGDLTLRLEQLERENNDLKSRVSSDRTYATTLQLTQAVDDLERTIHGAVATAKQTNAALDSLAKTQATRPTVQSNFSEDYVKEGSNYTVQKGDTIAVIAKKTGARAQDIVNANKLSDPSRIVVGQTLFIPNPPASAVK
jgi:LysM repeat protein